MSEANPKSAEVMTQTSTSNERSDTSGTDERETIKGRGLENCSFSNKLILKFNLEIPALLGFYDLGENISGQNEQEYL